jgi:DNA-binding transcriptional LysR family regulator
MAVADSPKVSTSTDASPVWAALWGHLHELTVLAEQGSFTAAAQRLGVSKAAVSQRLSELERWAGVPLVTRTTRSLRLTEAGQRLVEDTRASFAHIAQTWGEVRDLAGKPRGLLRVTAPVALARQQLVPHVASFCRQYPEVRLQLDLSDRLVSLAQEGFDLAIRHTANPPDTHIAWRLCTTHSVLVASPAYLEQHGEPTTPTDLESHDCLHYPRALDTPAWTFLRRKPTDGSTPEPGERITVPVRGPFAASNSEALRDAALADLGIALVPDFSAQSALASGRLKVILSDWVPVCVFAESLYALRPYTPYVPRAVAAFVQHLRMVWAGGFGDV